MRWRSASLAASSCALLLGGCGGEQHQQSVPQPKLPRSVARELAARAERVARRLDANDRCGAVAEATKLQRDVIQAINAHRVPSSLQEPLQSATNGLVLRVGACVQQPENGHGPKPEKRHKHNKKEKREER
jgi:hypothetical protein